MPQGYVPSDTQLTPGRWEQQLAALILSGFNTNPNYSTIYYQKTTLKKDTEPRVQKPVSLLTHTSTLPGETAWHHAAAPGLGAGQMLARALTGVSKSVLGMLHTIRPLSHDFSRSRGYSDLLEATYQAQRPTLVPLLCTLKKKRENFLGGPACSHRKPHMDLPEVICESTTGQLISTYQNSRKTARRKINKPKQSLRNTVFPFPILRKKKKVFWNSYKFTPEQSSLAPTASKMLVWRLNWIC